MSSALSSRSESSSAKNWWGKKDLRQSSSSSSNSISFNNLASAIGLKSKKHPSLAIQDPPLPRPPRVEPIHTPANRPPSKSISSTRSRVDSLEPRTPVDSLPHRDPVAARHSLLTLSDADPFASRGISMPNSPLDPNRLSAYSGSSEYFSKKTDGYRGSIASSNSQYHSDISSPTFVEQPYRLSSKKSMGSLHRKASIVTSEDAFSAWQHINDNKSSSTLTDKNRLSQPEPSAPRPRMRARGLTESGSVVPVQFLRDSPSYSSPDIASPRVIVRQASFSRAGLPPSAPPSHELPRLPTADKEDDASSSSLSFSSHPRELQMVNQHYTPRPKAQPTHQADVMSSKGHHVSRSLKKSISHQNLTKKSGLPTTPPTPNYPAVHSTPTTPQHEYSPEISLPQSFQKHPRKQRSFHRIPIPTRSPSSTPQELPPSSSTRRRLFSGGARPSTSEWDSHKSEDDVRSVFSLPVDNHYATFDASTPEIQPTSEYIPQQIISPAEMLKIEASVQQQERERRAARERGMSTMSTSTVDSDNEDLAESNSLPSSLRLAINGGKGSSRFSSRSCPPASNGNPRRLRPDTETGLIPLSPPPRRKKAMDGRLVVAVRSPVAPSAMPALSSMNSNSNGNNRRRSIMRKPSFLDIGGDEEEGEEVTEDSVTAESPSVIRKVSIPKPSKVRTPVLPPAMPGSSFLDLARESFDSTRSSIDD